VSTSMGTAFFLNVHRLKVSKTSVNELVELISNCNLTEVYLEVKDVPEMVPADFEAMRRTLGNKIKFATVVFADEE
jgi:hypothetical protein